MLVRSFVVGSRAASLRKSGRGKGGKEGRGGGKDTRRKLPFSPMWEHDWQAPER